MKKLYYRTCNSTKWKEGPGVHVDVLEALFIEFSPLGYNPYWSERSDSAFYVIETRNLKKVIDGLKGMTDEAFRNQFSFEGEELHRMDVIADLEDLYQNRDMNWHGGNRIFLEWY